MKLNLMLYKNIGAFFSISTLANIPTNVSVSDEAYSNVGVSWDANSNPAGTNYLVAAFDSNDLQVSSNTWTTNTNDIIENLISGTVYSIKVKAKNIDNIETPWLDIAIITKQ